jgi:site-specific recombinase XerD
MFASCTGHGGVRVCRTVLNGWLKFRGRFKKKKIPTVHEPWLGDYLDFLMVHRGLKPSTRSSHERIVGEYLVWQFGSSRPDWSRVRVEDLWRYAAVCFRGRKPAAAQGRLSALRQFLSFVQLRGACSPQLSAAVPKVADFRRSSVRTVLDPKQRRRLLGCFDLRTAMGRRDYTLALLMVDLGLRVGEVAQLRLDHIDWHRRRLLVPPAKTPRGRALPLPRHVAEALRLYLKQVRPPSQDPHLFLRHRSLIGRPMSLGSIKIAMYLACRRCGFPKHCRGTHILRRTFATDVHARGATMRQVADLLGHQQLGTTGIYTQIAFRQMRSLAQPWPVRS